MHTHAHTCTHTRTHAHTHMYTYTHTHICRTRFPHQKKSARNELTFDKGQIFHVVDTLPLGHAGMWRVERVGSKGETGEMGLVPISLT